MSDTERSHRLYSGQDGAVWVYLDYDNGRAVRLRILNQSNKPLSVKLAWPGGDITQKLLAHNFKEKWQAMTRTVDGVKYASNRLTQYVAADPVEIPLDFPVQVGPSGPGGFTSEIEHG